MLRDGSTVHIRAARPDDLEALEDYFIGLSDESRRLRFSGLVVDVRAQARNAVEIDYVDHLTLLAFTGGDDQRVVGGAQYIRETDRRAEIALSVTDALQGQGLASILIGHLAQAAGENGIEFFRAEVLPENHRMIDVFRHDRVPGLGPHDAGRGRDRVPDRGHRRDGRALRGAHADRGGERRAHGARGALDRGDRRLPGPDEHRRPAAEEPARPAVRRSRLSGEPESRRGPGRSRVPRA